MLEPTSRTSAKIRKWPHIEQVGRGEAVTIYRRRMPNGGYGYRVANYSTGERKLDSFSTEADALDAAKKLAKRLSERDVISAQMTRDDSVQYSAAVQTLKPFGVGVQEASCIMAEALKVVGTLPHVLEAARYYAARHKRTTPKRVGEVVRELLEVKRNRGASKRYLEDLTYRLNRFSEAFQRDTCNVTTSEVQEWLDSQKLEPQSYANFRRVLHLFFEFATARSYSAENPVQKVETVKVRGKDITIFTPAEIARLLNAASAEFLPCIALGAFAGLRSAEIERLEWSDIDLASRHIVVGASRAKTASRRIVPISENLAEWLTPYAHLSGLIWKGGHDDFYDEQQATAEATRVEPDPVTGTVGKAQVKWKPNALRHSYASYRFAQIGDAGRVAGEMGNSAALVFRHYRELVKAADAQRWFSIAPANAENVTSMRAEACA